MRILKRVNLKKYSGFGTGGCAEELVEVYTRDDLKKAAKRKRTGDWSILGGGFNTLISDSHISAPLLRLKGVFSEVKVEGDLICAGGGAFLSKILHCSVESELGGLEFLAGIPGTAGGGVMTNCGAFGSSISDFLTEIEIFDPDSGEYEKIYPSQAGFGYRVCNLERIKPITEIKLSLKSLEKSDIIQNIKKNFEKKKENQPVNEKSCGSVFKNPSFGPTAGQLIEKTGLKELTIGGAKVSGKHANYIINTGSATSFEILSLIKVVRNRVKEKFSVDLEPELNFLGFDSEKIKSYV